METGENEKKKEYLKSYGDLVRQMKRSELKIKEMRLNKMLPSMINDGMPHASNQTDLSGYAVLLDQEERRHKEDNCRRIQKCAEISARIEQLSDENEKDVLMYRYIKLLKWEEIAAKMGFSWQHIHKIHARALNNFKMR